ncbi:hypothetical protein WA026_020531 [Henosepilachna vigintioctopunctata]|uniref:Uncharacterized protein n=1 Tax=Henosepilachna vigintioctopunctata TaxID=420089 RepID=A0AAW1VI33_9CUCU
MVFYMENENQPRKITTHSIQPQYKPEITINFNAQQKNEVITSNIKYHLGIERDNKVKLKLSIITRKRKVITGAKHFRQLIYRDQWIRKRTSSSILYKSICRPLLYLHLQSVINALLVAETSSLRTLTRMRHPENILYNPPNQLLYAKTNTQPIMEQIKKLNDRFPQRLKMVNDISNLMHNKPVQHLHRK